MPFWNPILPNSSS